MKHNDAIKALDDGAKIVQDSFRGDYQYIYKNDNGKVVMLSNPEGWLKETYETDFSFNDNDKKANDWVIFEA